MDWKGLFLTSAGRLGQKDFWIAWLILFGANFVAGMIPLLGPLIVLALIYPSVCVSAKRLHDFGKSGWLAALPFAIGAVATIVSLVMGGMALVMGAVAGDTAGALTAAGGLGLAGLVMFLAVVASLGFLLWLGLSKGDPESNAYGPPPAPVFGGASPTAV